MEVRSFSNKLTVSMYSMYFSIWPLSCTSFHYFTMAWYYAYNGCAIQSETMQDNSFLCRRNTLFLVSHFRKLERNSFNRSQFVLFSICGDKSRECVCDASSETECHQCCLDSTGICSSAYDARNANIPSMLRAVGTPCNYSLGVCGLDGRCQPLGDRHPLHRLHNTHYIYLSYWFSLFLFY